MKLGVLWCAGLLILLSVFPALGASKWVEATGRSVIGGDLAKAKSAALEDALHQALIAYGVNVQSATKMKQRTQVDETVSMQAKGTLSNVQVVEEQAENNIYYVRIRAEVGPQGSVCRAGVHRFHKSVLFTPFSRQQPDQARLGYLQDVDQRLPMEFIRRGYHSSQLLGQLSQSPDSLAAPGAWGVSGMSLSSMRKLAEKHNAQFVVTGNVQNMAMADYAKFAATSNTEYALQRGTNKVKKWLAMSTGKDPKLRAFEFQLRLFDAVSGQVVFDKLYSASGLWQSDINSAVGFASDAFWANDYGKKVAQVIDRALLDLDEKLACQPFMTPIKSIATGGGVFIDAGANSGVRVGDVFQVFRQSRTLFNDSDYTQTRAMETVDLQQTEVSMIITQVYPGYSRARLSEALHPHSQYIGVVW